MILYGPPGVGKTTIAAILAQETNYVFVELSATDGTLSTLKQLSKIIEDENNSRQLHGQDYLGVVVFIDEIHRFRIDQQDFLLPLVEQGLFVFIGATTVNPKLRIRRAILSRCQVYELHRLDHTDLQTVFSRAVLYENIRRRVTYGRKFIQFSPHVRDYLIESSLGDSRKLINWVELLSKDCVDEYTGVFSPVNIEMDAVKRFVTSKSSKVDCNSLYRELFGTLRSSDNEYKIQRPQLVKYTRSPSSYMVSIKVKNRLITDSNDQFHRSDALKYILASDNLQEFTRSREMEFSENEESPTGYLSDSPLDYEAITPATTKLKKRLKTVSAMGLLLMLLKTESPVNILRNLMLFSAIYVKDNSLLPKLMGLRKALTSVNIDISKAMSNVIEKLVKARKLKVSLQSKLQLAHMYIKVSIPQPKEPTVVFDDSLVESLLTETNVPSVNVTTGLSVGYVEHHELDDSEYNVGDGDVEIFADEPDQPMNSLTTEATQFAIVEGSQEYVSQYEDSQDADVVYVDETDNDVSQEIPELIDSPLSSMSSQRIARILQ